MKFPNFHTSGAAFSLVEVLVVIAVIGIFAAIAIPNISNVTKSADKATKLRIAQTLASTYNSYVEAYYSVNNSYPTYDSVEAAISAMAVGQTVINPRLNSTNLFRVPGITTNSVAVEKLTFTNNQLFFNPDA